MTDKGKVSVNKIKDSFTVGLKVAKAAVSNDEFGVRTGPNPAAPKLAEIRHRVAAPPVPACPPLDLNRRLKRKACSIT